MGSHENTIAGLPYVMEVAFQFPAETRFFDVKAERILSPLDAQAGDADVVRRGGNSRLPNLLATRFGIKQKHGGT